MGENGGPMRRRGTRGHWPNKNLHIVLFERHCHATEKSEAIEVIPVNKMVDPKRIMGENGGPRRRRGNRGH
jgi:hypothetical protein